MSSVLCIKVGCSITESLIYYGVLPGNIIYSRVFRVISVGMIEPITIRSNTVLLRVASLIYEGVFKSFRTESVTK